MSVFAMPSICRMARNSSSSNARVGASILATASERPEASRPSAVSASPAERSCPVKSTKGDVERIQGNQRGQSDQLAPIIQQGVEARP